MRESSTYQISIHGRVDANDLNAMSPLQMTVADVPAKGESAYPATQLTVHADQAALIGLLRHLHARGFVILSVNREL
ncbi:MAG: hypothetical protein JXB38_15875 [Anaerolineales bacterium]|nr:hypothetical protein [Anaerolineales bacterium]